MRRASLSPRHYHQYLLTSISGVRSNNTNGAPSYGPDATVTGLNHTARMRRENARTKLSNCVESALAVGAVVVVCVGGQQGGCWVMGWMGFYSSLHVCVFYVACTRSSQTRRGMRARCLPPHTSITYTHKHTYIFYLSTLTYTSVYFTYPGSGDGAGVPPLDELRRALHDG